MLVFISLVDYSQFKITTTISEVTASIIFCIVMTNDQLNVASNFKYLISPNNQLLETVLIEPEDFEKHIKKGEEKTIVKKNTNRSKKSPTKRLQSPKKKAPIRLYTNKIDQMNNSLVLELVNFSYMHNEKAVLKKIDF